MLSSIGPYRRTARPFTDGGYQFSGKGKYLRCRAYAQDGRRYIRAAMLIESDLVRLFEYIEADAKNFPCYSFQIHSLIVRTCIEIEANFRAILSENGYKKSGNWNITDFRKVESTHRLSEYRVKVPDFTDGSHFFVPFSGWMEAPQPEWYTTYNSVKHDRHHAFASANFETLLNAVSALFALLASQFHTEGLVAGKDYLSLAEAWDDGFVSVAGSFFRVEFPKSWREEERYNFEYKDIRDEASFFKSLDK